MSKTDGDDGLTFGAGLMGPRKGRKADAAWINGATPIARDMDHYRHKEGIKKRPNALPTGGGGGAWAEMNRTMADSRAVKTQAWVQQKLAEGEFFNNGGGAGLSGTSIFDPVLTELCYRWFCPPGGTILDPFAGGSVRGIVAGKLGRQYVGVDLSDRQLKANEAQAARILDPESDIDPIWIAGDSLNLAELAGRLLPEAGADFLFSCPPYGDLEVYSDDPRDLSTMAWAEFLDCYRDIVAAAAGLLAPNRFACFVVGDFRGPDGVYRGLPWRTVEAFEAAGLRLYNEAVLVTAAGSLPLRTRKQFEVSRKFGKTHQNVLVFIKGDARLATQAIGPVEFYAGEDPGEEAPPQTESTEFPNPAVQVNAHPDSEPTPIEARGPFWVKRDDLFERAGVSGGKVRTCWHLATRQKAAGLVTAGSRSSPQVNIVAHIARQLGIPCRAHTPTGDLGPEVAAARAAGAEIVQHKAGYNSVIVARARDDAHARGWVEIPFGMECAEAVAMTASQVRGIPEGVKRLVVPVGSGMSLAGILTGLEALGLALPVLGVAVGADPAKRLANYAPPGWRERVDIVTSGVPYDRKVEADIEGLELDPIYEAKCIQFLEPGDLFWIVGVRATL